MQSLLPEIRDQLQALSGLHRKSDAYVTPHENWMPTGTRQPCVGIKDAGTSRRELGCGALELRMSVALACFVHMAGEGETPLCGDAGLFMLADAATDLLLAGWLDVAGCQALTVGNDRPSEMFQADNGQFLVKMVRTVVYTVER